MPTTTKPAPWAKSTEAPPTATRSATATATATPARTRADKVSDAQPVSPTPTTKRNVRAPRKLRAKRPEQANAGAHVPLLYRRGGRKGDWATIYFASLEATGGNYTRSCRAAGVGRTTVWERRQREPEFEREEIAAIKRGIKTLESEAVRRAVEGVRKIRFEPKTGKIHYEREYSDTLMLRLLEHSETGSWQQKQKIEHSGGLSFRTRSERKAALEQARTALQQQPVTAVNGRS